MSALKELDKIEGRANAATEGKWTVGRDGPFPEVRAGILRHRIDFSFAPGGRAQADVDAEFIAHAREDVPQLVAALRAVQEISTNLRGYARQNERLAAEGSYMAAGYWKAYTQAADRLDAALDSALGGA